jgi:hypothetical protein
MVRLLLIAVAILASALQVLAKSGITTSGRHINSPMQKSKLTVSLAVDDHTNTGHYKLLNFNTLAEHADTHLQKALQVIQKEDRGHVCGQMAHSGLIHTCGTFKSEDEEQQPTEQTLEREKKLYAARLAVCELQDSNDRKSIPVACESFIPTEENTKRQDVIGHISANGHNKPVSRYPDYDTATRQDLDLCVAALNRSPQAWSSYSNAKQSANNMCPAARAGIEKDELLQLFRAGFRAQASSVDASHIQAKMQEHLTEVLQSFKTKMHDLVQFGGKGVEKVEERFNDVVEMMQAASQSLQAQMQEHSDRRSAVLKENDRKVDAHVEGMLSKFQAALSQQSTDVALAQSKSADATREHMDYYNERLQQGLMQIYRDASGREQEVAVMSSQILQGLNHVSDQINKASEKAMALTGTLSNLSISAQEIEERQEAVNVQLTTIESKLSVISGILDRFPAMIWHCRYAIVACAVLLLKLCIGGPSIFQLLGSTLKYIVAATSSILAGAAGLTRRDLVATGSATLVLLAAVFILVYILMIEPPDIFLQRWEADQVPQSESFLWIVLVAFLAAYLTYVIILTLVHLMYRVRKDEQEILLTYEANESQSCDAKGYDEMERTV